VTYSITYRNTGVSPFNNIVINDMTPSFTTFVSAAFDVLPNDLTACTITAPAVGAEGAIRWHFTGALAPGKAGVVSFVVQVK
jgi:hypothetical protein